MSHPLGVAYLFFYYEGETMTAKKLFKTKEALDTLIAQLYSKGLTPNQEALDFSSGDIDAEYQELLGLASYDHDRYPEKEEAWLCKEPIDSQIPLLEESMIKDDLRKDTSWQQSDDFWMGNDTRFTQAPYGYDINVVDNTFGDFEDGLHKCVVYKLVLNEGETIPSTGQEILFEFMIDPKDYPSDSKKTSTKHIEFILEDIPHINKLFGLRGTLRMTTDISFNKETKEYKDGNTYCYFKSSFAEEEVSADHAYRMIKDVLLLRGLTLEYLFSLEENKQHNLSLAQIQPVETPKSIYLIFSTDEFQSCYSFQLENYVTNISAARKVVADLLSGRDAKKRAVIKHAKLDSSFFIDFESYHCKNGLDWKHFDSEKEFGYLPQPSKEDEDD
jgi:hypothetical protein